MKVDYFSTDITIDNRYFDIIKLVKILLKLIYKIKEIYWKTQQEF